MARCNSRSLISFLPSLSSNVPSVIISKIRTEINDPQVRRAGATVPDALTCGVKCEQEAGLFRYEEAHHLLPQRPLAGSKALGKGSDKRI
jgi:hypothetical protein